MSLKYNKNNNGPKTDPCGTPHGVTVFVKMCDPTCVVCVRFCK